MKRKDLHPRLLYPARLLFNIEGEIKSFPDKKKLLPPNQYCKIHKWPSFKQKKEKQKIEIERNIGMKNKMAVNKNLSLITLNVMD